MRTQVKNTIDQIEQKDMSICPLIGATILFTIAEDLQVSATVCEVGNEGSLNISRSKTDTLFSPSGWH